jgi:hypothetical protein
MSDKQFISYLNDEGETIEGYFEVINVNQSYIEFRSHGNIIRIPWHRVLKNKEKEGENE